MKKTSYYILAILCLLFMSSVHAQKNKRTKQNAASEQNSVSGIDMDLHLHYNLPVRVHYFQNVGQGVAKKLDSLKTEIFGESGIIDLSKTSCKYNTCEDLIPTLNSTHFGFEHTVHILNANPHLKLIIDAFICDQLYGTTLEGELEMARNINEKRLEIVRNLFIQCGVPQEQIETASYTMYDNSLFKKYRTNDAGGVIYRIAKR